MIDSDAHFCSPGPISSASHKTTHKKETNTHRQTVRWTQSQEYFKEVSMLEKIFSEYPGLLGTTVHLRFLMWRFKHLAFGPGRVLPRSQDKKDYWPMVPYGLISDEKWSRTHMYKKVMVPRVVRNGAYSSYCSTSLVCIGWAWESSVIRGRMHFPTSFVGHALYSLVNPTLTLLLAEDCHDDGDSSERTGDLTPIHHTCISCLANTRAHRPSKTTLSKWFSTSLVEVVDTDLNLKHLRRQTSTRSVTRWEGSDIICLCNEGGGDLSEYILLNSADSSSLSEKVITLTEGITYWLSRLNFELKTQPQRPR